MIPQLACRVLEQHYGDLPYARMVFGLGGQSFTAKPHPYITEAGHCFERAYHFVKQFPDRYAYCEGFAVNPLAGMLHAWVIDLEDGRALDLSWDTEMHDAYSYFGVVFPLPLVRQMGLTTGRYGVMSRLDTAHVEFGVGVIGRAGKNPGGSR